MTLNDSVVAAIVQREVDGASRSGFADVTPAAALARFEQRFVVFCDEAAQVAVAYGFTARDVATALVMLTDPRFDAKPDEHTRQPRRRDVASLASWTDSDLLVAAYASQHIAASTVLVPPTAATFDAGSIDPGVRVLVQLLRSQGFDTTDSGDAVSKFVRGSPYFFDATCSSYEECGILRVPHVHISSKGWRPAAAPNYMASAVETMGLCACHLRYLIGSLGIEVTPGMVQATFDPTGGSAVVSLYDVTDAMLPEAIRAAFAQAT